MTIQVCNKCRAELSDADKIAGVRIGDVGVDFDLCRLCSLKVLAKVLDLEDIKQCPPEVGEQVIYNGEQGLVEHVLASEQRSVRFPGPKYLAIHYTQLRRVRTPYKFEESIADVADDVKRD